MSFSTITFQPDELAMLQDIYRRILSEGWFARNEFNERDFAKAIVRLFQTGIADEDRLFVEALAVARSHFCTDTKPEKSPTSA
jgi:hypothetical protein